MISKIELWSPEKIKKYDNNQMNIDDFDDLADDISFQNMENRNQHPHRPVLLEETVSALITDKSGTHITRQI